MGRSFAEQIRSADWWLEQSAHWNAGDFVGSLVAIVVYFAGPSDPGLWAGVAAITAAAIAATVRELVQNIGDKNNNVPDAIADALFLTLGGCRASILFFVVWALS